MEKGNEMYGIRENRLNNAVSLKESDVVPVAAQIAGYPMTDIGHTVKEAVYNFDIAEESIVRFAETYQPDMLWGYDAMNLGKGPALELMQPVRLDWAGKPGGKNSDNSIHQIHDFSVLKDEEFEELNHDYCGWVLRKGLPRVGKLLEPLASLYSIEDGPSYDFSYFISEWSTPEFKEMIQKFWKINDMNNEITAKITRMEEKLWSKGFLTPMKGYAAIPLDNYGAFFRGTLDTMTDLYDNAETIEAYCERNIECQIESIRMQGQFLKGKWVAMYLTKGSDMFLGTEMFQKYYWKYLQRVIEEIVANGMVPYVYTEGAWNSRLEFLKDVPQGVVYHFEDSVNMKEAKKALSGTACITGGFPIKPLMFGTKDEVVDLCKKLIDDCAAGGGYIFETSSGFDEAKHENVEAMYQTVREYGKK